MCLTALKKYLSAALGAQCSYSGKHYARIPVQMRTRGSEAIVQVILNISIRSGGCSPPSLFPSRKFSRIYSRMFPLTAGHVDMECKRDLSEMIMVEKATRAG